MSRSELYQSAKALGYSGATQYPSGSTAFWRRQVALLQTVEVVEGKDQGRVIEFDFIPTFTEGNWADNNWQSLKDNITERIDDDSTFYINFQTSDGAERLGSYRSIEPIRLPMRDSYWIDVTRMLARIYDNPNEYNLIDDTLTIQLVEEITENPPLEDQREGFYNCVAESLLFPLLKVQKSYEEKYEENPCRGHKYKLNKVKKRIARTKAINQQLISSNSGVNDEIFQKLARASEFNIRVVDSLKNKWREFIYSKKNTTIVLEAHNFHCSPDDEEFLKIHEILRSQQLKTFDEYESKMHYYATIGATTDFKLDENFPENIVWFDSEASLKSKARDLMQSGILIKQDIISKKKLIGLITEDTVYKLRFDEYEDYPTRYTDGGVGKAKLLEMLPSAANRERVFDDLLIKSDRCGFYMRSGASKPYHHKYDQNHSYKSFRSSIFQGFPIIEAVYDVAAGLHEPGQYFSECPDEIINGKGLLLVEWPELTITHLKSMGKIFYEGTSWVPVEIVLRNYMEFDIDPKILQFAYASETFDIDESKFSNNQFRSLIGKCISKFSHSVWRTFDYNEFLRARYILKDKISHIYTERAGEKTVYCVEYKNEEKPWQFPILSVIVKAHQKHKLFTQYNELIDNNILPVAVTVDGIETKRKCDHLFDISTLEGGWKKESIYVPPSGIPEMVIHRDPTEPQPNTIRWADRTDLPRLTHLSGSGGNGKTQKVVSLIREFPNICYTASSNKAAKVLTERGKTLGLPIQASTYHYQFGIGCRGKDIPDASHFVIEEASMCPSEHLKIIDEKLRERFDSDQSFGGKKIILCGDFWQLPAVSPLTPLYDNWTGEKDELYENFTEVELTKNWRQQSDPEFFALCQKIRGVLTKEEANDILKRLDTRVLVPDVAIEDQAPGGYTSMDDSYIAGINAQVKDINDPWNAMKKGCKVICNDTVRDSEKRMIANGEVGVVVRNKKNAFWVKFNGKVSKFRSIGKSKRKPRFTPAYAMTVHKSQGSTYKGNVVIDPSRLFEKNHLYVALTRATAFDRIFLTKKMTLKTFMKTVNVR